MPKYAVYGIMSASRFIGEFEAENEEDAKAMAMDSEECHVSLCHHCAGEVELGDMYEWEAEEI